MITPMNREQILCTNTQEDFVQAQQALSREQIAFRTEVRDNAQRMLQRQDVLGIRAQYQREYRIYVHRQDAELARHILQYGNNG